MFLHLLARSSFLATAAQKLAEISQVRVRVMAAKSAVLGKNMEEQIRSLEQKQSENEESFLRQEPCTTQVALAAQFYVFVARQDSRS
jgi:hypothetical protein